MHQRELYDDVIHHVPTFVEALVKLAGLLRKPSLFDAAVGRSDPKLRPEAPP
jgi:hypothetical protein